LESHRLRGVDMPYQLCNIPS